MSFERQIEIRIPSRYQDIDLVRRVLSSLSDDIPLAPDALLKIEICVVEGVGNAIRHAYGLRDDGIVEVGVTLASDHLVVEVSDRGRAMSSENRQRLKRGPTPRTHDPLAVGSVPESGMGFPILRAVLDDLEYTSQDGCNTLKMTKILSPAQAAPA